MSSSGITPEIRAELTRGFSNEAIYKAVGAEVLRTLPKPDSRVLDLGCGRCYLRHHLPETIEYTGVDVVQYEEMPSETMFALHDVQTPGIPFPAASFDIVIACEVVPCIENPRVIAREAARLLAPNGIFIVTSPNCRSLLSLATLLLRGEFNAFQEDGYPFMITPVLEADLLKIVREVGLTHPNIFYTGSGRIPKIGRPWPRFLTGLKPRWFSDHLGLSAVKCD